MYESYKDHFSEEDVERLEKLGGITLNSSEIERASKATKHDPLILDLNRNNLYSTTLEDGTHYDYGEDGMN